jgi:hypothetical protein
MTFEQEMLKQALCNQELALEKLSKLSSLVIRLTNALESACQALEERGAPVDELKIELIAEARKTLGI